MSDLEKVMEQGYAEAQVRVRYAETDQMGVVYHANYLVWFEVGRVECIRQLGLDYKSMEEDGAMIAVAEVTARYKAPARYDDELIVRTSLSGVRGPLVRFRDGVVGPAERVGGGGGEAGRRDGVVRGRDRALCGGTGYEATRDAGEVCGALRCSDASAGEEGLE